MKILIVLPNNSLGGAEQYLKLIATFYKNEDVNIVYFKMNSSTEWNNLKNDITQSYMSSISEVFGLLLFVLGLFKTKKQYDFIFTSHVYTNALVDVLLSIRLLKTKRFIARESTSIFLRYKRLKLFTYKLSYFIGYRKMNLLICQTELMKKQLLKHFSVIEKRILIKVIPNPINLDEIRIKVQEKIKPNLPDRYIVSAGRLIEEKGYDILINVFSKVNQHDKNLKLIILGKGKLIEPLEAQVARLNLSQDIIFTGHVNNVYRYFKNAMLCVVSSRIEGFPNVLLQMMSQNNNVVSTKCAGGIDSIPKLITAEVEDENSLLDAILKGLSKSDNHSNREVFDDYLSQRDIHMFIKKIMNV